MNRREKTGKAGSSLRRGLWLGMAIILAAPLGGSRLTLGQDDLPKSGKENNSSLSAVKMPIRGPDHAVVGRRFTLEVLITNMGTSTVKDLEFLAGIDPTLEHESGARNHRVKVEPIDPQNLQIVRLRLIPKKKGQVGVDITLRAKNGETHKVRHQLSVLAEEDVPVNLLPKGMRVTITPPKEFFADRPGMFLIYVVNTGNKATEKKQDLVVSYATASLLGNILPMSGPGPIHSRFSGGKGGGMGLMMVQPSNPIRQTKVSLPSLDPGEGWTIPVPITPRRIGEFRVSLGFTEAFTPIKPPNGPPIQPQVLASTAVKVKFDPLLPLEQLLPSFAGGQAAPRLPEKLADVPEVSFEGPHSKTMKADEAFEHIAHTVDKIHHVNAKKTDAFVEALLSKRSDLAGMPMAMGDSCRLTPERGNQFLIELQNLRVAMGNAGNLALGLSHSSDKAKPEARIAALMQVLGPESAHLRQEMVKVFAAIPHRSATRALASIAIFAEEEPVRRAAIDALKTRNEKDYSDILLQGLNYPWPAVAERTGEAIAKLKRNDMFPQLVDMLENTDPRAPQTKDIHGKKVPVVRELVKVNHLRNCLLCHAPAATLSFPDVAATQLSAGKKIPANFAGGNLTAPVPLPNQQLPTPSPSGGYGQFSIPGTLVRIDVTYLRQDFSLKLPVAYAKPSPDVQRFDFLVRTRQVTEQEAKAYRDLLRPSGKLSPYQQVALATLRNLTGQDAEPTASAWRRLMAAKNGTEKAP